MNTTVQLHIYTQWVKGNYHTNDTIARLSYEIRQSPIQFAQFTSNKYQKKSAIIEKKGNADKLEYDYAMKAWSYLHNLCIRMFTGSKMAFI